MAVIQVRVSLQLAGQALASVIPQIVPTAGPPIPPRAQPVKVQHPLPPRGIVRGIAGAALAVSVLGPPLIPLHQPVHAARPLPRAGKVITLRIVQVAATPGTGPRLYPLHAPVRASVPFPVLKGRSFTGSLPSPAAPPQAAPLSQPASIRVMVLRAGHVQSSAGTYAGEGPAVRPLTSPIRVRQPLPPAGRVLGITRMAAQAPAPTTGPVLYPLRQPVRGRLPQPGPGRAATMSVLEFTPGTPTSGPPLTPLHQPVRAVIPAPARGGHTITRTGTFSGTGPVVTPLTSPVKARQPRPPRGVRYTRTGVLAGTGPQLTPLKWPIVPAVRVLPPAGKSATRAGVYSGEGPAVRPLTGPVRARQPLPRQGLVLVFTGLPRRRPPR